MKSLLSSFFGDVFEGRLGRKAFLWRILVIFGLFVGSSIAMGLTGGIKARVVFYVPISLAAGLAALNVLAKRFRDVGVPGWYAVAAAVGFGIFLAEVAPGPIEFFYPLGLLAVLTLLPRV